MICEIIDVSGFEVVEGIGQHRETPIQNPCGKLSGFEIAVGDAEVVEKLYSVSDAGGAGMYLLFERASEVVGDEVFSQRTGGMGVGGDTG